MSHRTSALRVLGLSGGLSATRAVPDEMRRAWWSPTNIHWRHDSAAVLICDGKIAAGVEEERLNRIKHTIWLARHAITACLEVAGLTIDELTRIAYYCHEDQLDDEICNSLLRRPDVRSFWTAREHLARALSHDLETEIDAARIVFVEHHLAHAASAYFVGPFSEALVVTLDAIGDGIAGTIWAGERGELRRLFDLPHRDSLGELYLRTIEYLGYGGFEEYKVMGLAPYGDPGRFQHVFEPVCRLRPQGGIEVKLRELRRIGDVMAKPRRAGEPLTDVHKDLAAALQETVERATFHVLTHYRRETGLRYLCLAGGVAHNSTMVGKIARSSLFDGVFAQPAAHDAGCALGAAAYAHHALRPEAPIQRMADVYWGRPVGDTARVGARVAEWSAVADVVRVADVAAATAALLDEGAVIGWVQGRSEFGPRALGNRSILADPRPAANKDRINALVKERESYRPFAPAVLEEYADAFFEMPPGTSGAFMTFTVPVRAHARGLLGAVTHVDGTARVQTVSRTTNERFWALLEAFRQRTGTPILLNTSFNHSVEPIVDSLDDALTCLLTTGLTHLVVDEYLVTTRPQAYPPVWHLVPLLPEYVRLTHALEGDTTGSTQSVYRCEHLTLVTRTRRMTAAAYRVVERADGQRTVRELVGAEMSSTEVSLVVTELGDLWARRLLRFAPPAAARRQSSAPHGEPSIAASC